MSRWPECKRTVLAPCYSSEAHSCQWVNHPMPQHQLSASYNSDFTWALSDLREEREACAVELDTSLRTWVCDVGRPSKSTVIKGEPSCVWRWWGKIHTRRACPWGSESSDLLACFLDVLKWILSKGFSRSIKKEKESFLCLGMHFLGSQWTVLRKGLLAFLS